jgi:iron complex transport system ATP-binding protein
MKRSKTILNVQQLRIERGGTVILHDLTWRIARGEHWAVLGANGSGKTSLLSAITGYLMPTAGEIELLGHEYGRADWREVRCLVGIVSSSLRQQMADTEPALNTVASGKRAIIDLWKPISLVDRRAALRILKTIECAHLAQRPWAVLSQGERQRILIGRALMARPQLLILDEPCAGLDPAAREHVLQFIERLARQRNAPCLVLVTHHVEEITPAFSHALLLHEGRILRQGTRDKVITSSTLSQTFGSKIKLTQQKGRYALRVTARAGKVM